MTITAAGAAESPAPAYSRLRGHKTDGMDYLPWGASVIECPAQSRGCAGHRVVGIIMVARLRTVQAGCSRGECDLAAGRRVMRAAAKARVARHNPLNCCLRPKNATIMRKHDMCPGQSVTASFVETQEARAGGRAGRNSVRPFAMRIHRRVANHPGMQITKRCHLK